MPGANGRSAKGGSADARAHTYGSSHAGREEVTCKQKYRQSCPASRIDHCRRTRFERSERSDAYTSSELFATIVKGSRLVLCCTLGGVWWWAS